MKRNELWHQRIYHLVFGVRVPKRIDELEVVERISRETVRTTLKKTNLSPG